VRLDLRLHHLHLGFAELALHGFALGGGVGGLGFRFGAFLPPIRNLVANRASTSRVTKLLNQVEAWPW
jgi:hypothetical protein